MDCVALIAAAQADGLTVTIDGGHLKIKGPRRAERLAKTILERKAEVLSLLSCKDHTLQSPDSADADTTPLLLEQNHGSVSASARKVEPVEGLTWPDDLSELVAWFLDHADELPREPFHLAPWAHVVNPSRFYAALKRDITEGPRGTRARFGGLGDDLRRLRTLFGHPEPHAHL